MFFKPHPRPIKGDEHPMFGQKITLIYLFTLITLCATA